MELIDLIRYYDPKMGEVTYELEIAYSTGRCKHRRIFIYGPMFKDLQWEYETERFKMEVSWGMRFGYGHIANKDLDRIERFIEEVIEDEVTADVYIGETMQILLDRVAEKEAAYREKQPNRSHSFTAIYRGPECSESPESQFFKVFEGFDAEKFESEINNR